MQIVDVKNDFLPQDAVIDVDYEYVNDLIGKVIPAETVHSILVSLGFEILSADQKRLVRPFAIPIPTREVVMLTTTTFVRQGIKQMMIDEIRYSVPERMLRMNNTEQRV